jgi:hypothetical protein
MVRMALVDAVVVIVFICKLLVGVVGFVCVVTLRLPRPHGLHGFFRRHPPNREGDRWLGSGKAILLSCPDEGASTLRVSP